MPYKNPPKRSEEYRKRAGEVRAKADAAHDKASRDALLQEADTWERMADYEVKPQLSQELPRREGLARRGAGGPVARRR